VDVRLPALDGHIHMLGLGGSPRLQFSDPEKSKLAARRIHERMRFEDVPPNYYDMYLKIARNGNDPDLARRIVSAWEKKAPKALDPKRWRARAEFQAGAYGAALRAASEVLRKEPGDKEMQKLAADARQRLEELLRPAPAAP
jgi:hypothetical protein